MSAAHKSIAAAAAAAAQKRRVAQNAAEDDRDNRPENQQQLNPWLASIPDMDDLGPTLKMVLESGKQNQFLSDIDDFVDSKNMDIQSWCSYHYKEFISSIDELLSVREDTHILTSRIQEMNKEIQQSGSDVLEKADELLRLRYIQQNIQKSITALTQCAQVLNFFVSSKQLMENQQYHQALKTLEKLEHVYMKRIMHYEFIKQMHRNIPVMRNKIKRAVTDDFRQWMVTIREGCGRVGEMMISDLAQTLAESESGAKNKGSDSYNNTGTEKLAVMGVMDLSGVDTSGSGSSSSSSSSSSNSPNDSGSSTPMSREKLKGMQRRNNSTVLLNVHLQRDSSSKNVYEELDIDFTVVYRCIHIYEMLGIPGEFREYYVENRRLQANLVLQPDNVGSFIKWYRDYFQKIAGFFIVEDTVFNSTDHLISRTQLEAAWEVAVSKVKAVLQEQIAFWTIPSTFLEIKDFMALFAQVMQRNGNYDVSHLMDFLESMRERYYELLEQKYSDELGTLFAEEKFEPMLAEDVQTYNEMIAPFELYEEEATEFPLALPFSKLVPWCCHTVLNFMTELFRFSKYLNEMDDFIRKGTDQFIIRCVNQRLEDLVATRNIGISQAVQISVNANYLVKACDAFENYFAQQRDDLVHMRLTARQAFQTTGTRAEDMIFQLVDLKIDSLFEGLYNANFTPNSAAKQSREYVMDVVTYLEVTFQWLEMVPQVINKGLHYSACKHISDCMMNVLLSDDVKKYNLNAILDLGKDLEVLKEFADHQNQEMLVQCFAEVDQLVTLFTSDNFEEILDMEIRMTKYVRLDVRKLVLILDKYKESSSFSFTKKDTKLKKRTVENVSKKLRDVY